MDTVSAFARRQESTTPVSTATADGNRALAVTATYLLSEEGRKASLLTGGDGRAVQQLTVHVPTNRLHLVSVDADGIARLKLRPRYQPDGEQGGLVRIDAPPTYDGPPDLEDLFRDAARNHQLERVYQTERHATKTKRREADRERRAQLAQAFLSDPAQRALVYPAPTPTHCYLASDHGRVAFHANSDEVPARDVPIEAHRRFRGDLRARREQNLQQRSAQLALHEEKKRVIAEWIAVHGTTEQRGRQAAGMLPMQEAVEAMTDEVFGVLHDRLQYVHDGDAQLQAHLRSSRQYADEVVRRADVLPTSENAVTATAAQFALVKEFQALLPNATVALRVHKVSWKRDPQVALAPVFSVLVTQRVGPFTFRREYAAPDSDSSSYPTPTR